MAIVRFICLFVLINASVFCSQKLTDFGYNIYSQFGEDGIVEKIFQIIGTSSKIAVEFGAADGFSCSNTANLWTKDPQWKAVLIEADLQRFNLLTQNIQSYSNCIPVYQRIGVSGSETIEFVLNQFEIKDTIDLLSIDVDGNDYYIFESIQNIKPRVIICEYNPSIPPHLDIRGSLNNFIGCSVTALQKVAREKGYTLVAITDANCIFILNKEAHKFSQYSLGVEDLKIEKHLSWIIYDYRGRYKVISTQNYQDPWGWSGEETSEEILGNIQTLNRRIIQKSRK